MNRNRRNNFSPRRSRRLALFTAAFVSAIIVPAVRAQVVTVPPDLGPGDQYRLLFVSYSLSSASSSDIATYNATVANDAAAVAELVALGATWTALGSTETVDARDNTGTDPTPAGSTGVPIYLLDGTRLADDYDQLWFYNGAGPLLAWPNVDVYGSTVSYMVFTGTDVGGVASAYPLGGGGSQVSTYGLTDTTGLDYLNSGALGQYQGFLLYGISSVLTAPISIENVTQNTLHTTLQDALDNANSGDAIELGPGTQFEDGIIFPAGLDVTITGSGMDQTFIDGGGSSNTLNAILKMVQTTALVSDLTLQNGENSYGASTAGLEVWDSFTVFRNVAFRDNVAARAHLMLRGTTNARFENCIFAGSSCPEAANVQASGEVEFISCLFYDNEVARTLVCANGTVFVINCTIVDSNASISTYCTVNAWNSIFGGSLRAEGNGVINTSRCLYQGATGNNINGTATFVDPANGDCRLAAGSLGIDAADFTAYSAAGGGQTDLNDDPRLVDDPGTPDTGSGFFNYLDVGAYEFQVTSTSPCPEDVNGDGVVNVSDLLAVLSAWGPCP